MTLPFQTTSPGKPASEDRRDDSPLPLICELERVSSPLPASAPTITPPRVAPLTVESRAADRAPEQLRLPTSVLVMATWVTTTPLPGPTSAPSLACWMVEYEKLASLAPLEIDPGREGLGLGAGDGHAGNGHAGCAGEGGRGRATALDGEEKPLSVLPASKITPLSIPLPKLRK